MTIYYVISLALRLLGLLRAADFFWEKHEVRVKIKEIADAQKNVDTLSDDAVIDELHRKYDHPD